MADKNKCSEYNQKLDGEKCEAEVKKIFEQMVGEGVISNEKKDNNPYKK